MCVECPHLDLVEEGHITAPICVVSECFEGLEYLHEFVCDL